MCTAVVLTSKAEMLFDVQTRYQIKRLTGIIIYLDLLNGPAWEMIQRP